MILIKKSSSDQLRLVIISLLGFQLFTCCVGSEHCYHVNGRYVCYFVPYAANKAGEEWEKAWQICRGAGATLPMIENQTMKDLVQKYMRAEVPGVEMWAAGRGVRSYTWKWLNDKDLQDSKLLDNQQYLSEVYDTHAIITSDLKMSGRYPGDKYHYACQYSGSTCDAKDAIPFGETDCLKTVTNEALRWYDARNLCIENGGDLPIFGNPRLIEDTREAFNKLKNATGIWIGLRKTWWLWKKPESMEEVKYTNWLDHDNYINRECLLLTQNGTRWRQQYCMTARRFFCQAVKTGLYSAQEIKAPTTDADSDYPHKMSITVGLSIPIVIVVGVASVLLTRKCKSRSNSGSGGDRSKNRSYPEEQIRLNGSMPVTSVSSGLEPKPISRNMKATQNDVAAARLSEHCVWVERENVNT